MSETAFHWAVLIGLVVSIALQLRAARRLRAIEERVMPTPEELKAALDALTTEVAATGTTEDSAVTFIAGIEAQLAAALAAATPQEVIDQITALQGQLAERRAALAAAIATTPPA